MARPLSNPISKEVKKPPTGTNTFSYKSIETASATSHLSLYFNSLFHFLFSIQQSQPSAVIAGHSCLKDTVSLKPTAPVKYGLLRYLTKTIYTTVSHHGKSVSRHCTYEDTHDFSKLICRVQFLHGKLHRYELMLMHHSAHKSHCKVNQGLHKTELFQLHLAL